MSTPTERRYKKSALASATNADRGGEPGNQLSGFFAIIQESNVKNQEKEEL